MPFTQSHKVTQLRFDLRVSILNHHAWWERVHTEQWNSLILPTWQLQVWTLLSSWWKGLTWNQWAWNRSDQHRFLKKNSSSWAVPFRRQPESSVIPGEREHRVNDHKPSISSATEGPQLIPDTSVCSIIGSSRWPKHFQGHRFLRGPRGRALWETKILQCHCPWSYNKALIVFLLIWMKNQHIFILWKNRSRTYVSK